MRRSELAQIGGSLVVALAIAAVAVIVVTAHFGPTSSAELEVREERIEAREEGAEERQQEREERREERGDSSGPG